MRLLLPLAVLLVAACDSASPISLPGETLIEGVTLRVDRTEVPRGATLELALINGSDRTLSTGSLGCAIVERQRGADWEQLESDNQHACILPLFVYEPGETHEESFLLDVEPGTVRLFHRFGLGREGGSEIRSSPIRVLP